MKLTRFEQAAFAAIVLLAAWYAFPSEEEKQSAGLRLNPPVESPAGVTFIWTGGSAGQSYRIVKRVLGTDEWQPVAAGLNPSGMYLLEGFTLDRNYQYRVEPVPQ